MELDSENDHQGQGAVWCKIVNGIDDRCCNIIDWQRTRCFYIALLGVPFNVELYTGSHDLEMTNPRFCFNYLRRDKGRDVDR